MSAERPAARDDPLPSRYNDGHYDTCAWRDGGPCDCPASDAASSDLSDEEVLAMWRRGELVVRTGRIHHGNLCVCPERGDGEWCDKCEGYALEQGR